jgi:ABC-type antimicrobial peptide transport system permease subunit
MFVLKNAWAALMRHKWRSLLVMLISVLVAFGTLFALCVTQADDTAHGSAYELQKPNAVIRPTSATLAKRDGADSTWTKQYLTWTQYSTYATAAQSKSIEFQYSFTESLPVRQSSSIKAIAGTNDQSADKTGGELTLRSFYTADAAKSNDLGTYTVVSGKKLNYKTQDKQSVIISQALAKKNNLKVGSKITVSDPSDASKTYTFKVSGIYKYTSDAPSGQGSDAKLAKDNRDNAIYMSYYTFGINGLDGTDVKGWSIPDLNIVFQLSSNSDYNKFVKAVKAAKLPAKYEVSSPVLTAYEASIAPLGTLNDRMKVISIILWAAGGLLLLGCVLLGIRGRKGEVGTGLLTGVSRSRMGWQLMLEVLMPTLLGAAIGIVASGLSAKALGSALANGQSTPPSANIIWKVIGWSVCASLVLAIIAALRAATFRTTTLFAAREEAAR